MPFFRGLTINTLLLIVVADTDLKYIQKKYEYLKK